MAGLLMRTLFAGGANGDGAKNNPDKVNVSAGYLALIWATLIALASPVVAFETPTRLEKYHALNGQCTMRVYVSGQDGGLAAARIQPVGSGSAQTQTSGGASFFKGNIGTTFPAVTAANLQANCSLTDVANLVQQGASGTYATASYIGFSFEATHTSDGNRYAYIAEISGQTATTVAASQTLVNTAPTVTLGSLSGPDGSGKYTVVATLSESSSDFTPASLTLTNATATVSGSGSSYTVFLTPLVDGAVSVSVPKEGFTDSGGLGNWVASNEVAFSADVTAPTVSIAAFTGPLNGTQSAVITLSEVSTDFTVADLSLGNATATLSGSGTSYTAVLTPLADGPVALSVAAGTFSDAAGNMNATGSNEVTTTYDGTAPVIRSVDDLTLDAAPSGTRQIGFSTIVDDNVDSGIAPVFSLNGGVITSPYDFPIGANQIKINATDSAGNQAVEEEFTITITPGTLPDSPVLTTTVINTNRSMTIAGTAEADGTVRITFPDASVETVTATGGMFSVTSAADMTGGTVSVTVEDNLGYVSPAATVDLFPDYDAPTINIGAFTGPLNGAQSAVITLSEASTDFTRADLTLSNATATLSGSGSSYTAVLTPIADGPVSLSVTAGSFSDAAGNRNAAGSNEVTTRFDTSAPSVSISSSRATVVGATTVEIAVTFSEDVIGFAASDIAVSNGSVTQLSGSGADYLVMVSTTGKGNTEISIPAATVADVAGNANTASNTLSISNAVVEETQKVIAQFMQSRATQLIASQPNLTGFLSGSNSSALNMAVTRGSGDFEFAAAPGADTGLWARLSGSWTHEGARKTSYAFGVIGSHVKLSPNLLVGGMIEFDVLSQKEGASRIDGQGWLIGPYFVARRPGQPVFFEGMLLYGETKNDISPFGTYADSFETERLLAQFKMSGEIDQGRTTWMPSVQLSYTTDTQRAYTDGLGNVIPEQGFELMQAELGLDVHHQVRLPRSSGALELTGGLAFVGSSTKGTGNASLVVPAYEGGRGKVKAGANYALPNGAILAVDAYYDGIGTAGYESYGVQFGFNLTF
ncbi:Ig-like domain-containing protein [Pseudophaeobacter sp.]|uniref:Ig-like domain-containing protein n=1 Tax=Pseudophaeobacter sp. TaxID=1971739 RepID=UPI002603427D|nr:Ig-like domain-containing protein [Pseudophaeobacter sp.]